MLFKKIKKINSQQIILEAKAIIDKAGWGPRNQIALQNSKEVGYFNDIDTYHAGAREENLVTNWHPDLELTYIKDVLSNLNFPVANVRLMKLEPLQCYSTHLDMYTRYHIPIGIDTANSFFVFPEHNKVCKMYENHIYWTNTYELHTYINSSFDERVNLIFNNANETKEMFEEYMKEKQKV